jgi:transcriptional regulator with XRE-family HTH domain
MIGEKIRLCRLQRGYSQEFMAFSLNISQNAYSKIEREQTELTVKRLYEIAGLLKISAVDLLIPEVLKAG